MKTQKGIFRFFATKEGAQPVNNQTQGKTTKELVQEIHETFNTEVERLLEMAGVTLPDNTNRAVIERANRLKSLGFNRAHDALVGWREAAQSKLIEKENAKRDTLKRAIIYFQQKYPHYKFIDDEGITRICKKYGLIHAPCHRYTGIVPEKNIMEMESFKINDDDICWQETTYAYHRSEITFISKSEGEQKVKECKKMCPSTRDSWVQPGTRSMAAPRKDFDLTGMHIDTDGITAVNIPDPVVFEPVVFEGNKYYLISTAWGDEASDEDVVNHIMN